MKTKNCATETTKLIFQYINKIAVELDPTQILSYLADMGRDLTQADRCTVWVANHEHTELWTKVAHGVNAISIPYSSGLVGHAISNNESMIIDDVYHDERFNRSVDNQTGYRTKSMLIIPLHNMKGEVIGAFQVINKLNDEKFTFEDMDFIRLASTFAAETIETSLLVQEIEETQKEVIYSMGEIGERRSKETGNHVKRVAEYSRILAVLYGLDDKEAEMLKMASPMHDIGKVGIPDAILNKPGSFTASEWKIMQTHAELGYETLKNSKREILKAAATVAYEHHEKWDGSGYPRGLAGEDIHIYGRITAVADVFDALGSDRVYKKAWPLEKILNLLKDGRGKHFEPKLVDLFLENIALFLEVRDKFKDTYVEEKSAYKNSIRILGAHGTKSKGKGTTSFEIDAKNVIDAGNLLSSLEEKAADIEHIYLTHAHLDHISDIAYVLDNYFSQRKATLHIHATKGTIEALRDHFLNDIIWPDFSKIYLMHSQLYAVEYHVIELNSLYKIDERTSIEAFKTDHTFSSCGYIVKKGESSVIIPADTVNLKPVVEIINAREDITAMVLECSFPSAMKQLAVNSKHLTPDMVFEQLQKLQKREINFYLHHLKPSYINEITEEISKKQASYEVKILKDGEKIEF